MIIKYIEKFNIS